MDQPVSLKLRTFDFVCRQILININLQIQLVAKSYAVGEKLCHTCTGNGLSAIVELLAKICLPANIVTVKFHTELIHFNRSTQAFKIYASHYILFFTFAVLVNQFCKIVAIFQTTSNIKKP